MCYACAEAISCLGASFPLCPPSAPRVLCCCCFQYLGIPGAFAKFVEAVLYIASVMLAMLGCVLAAMYDLMVQVPSWRLQEGPGHLLGQSVWPVPGMHHFQKLALACVASVTQILKNTVNAHQT